MSRQTDPTRRRLLALATAATATLAGCSGGDGGGDGSDDESGDGDDDSGADGDGDGGTDTDVDATTAEPTAESTNGGTTAADDTATADDGTTAGDGETTETAGPAGDCTDFEPDAYARFDGAGEPFVATFEYPDGEGSGSISMGTVNGVRSATIIQDVRGERFYVFVEQDLEGTDERTPADRGETDGFEQFDTLAYEGEDVPLVRSTSPGQFEYTLFAAGLPYEHADGTTQYYHVELNATSAYADSADNGECDATWGATAEHVLRSLEPNPDTTVEDEAQ